MGIVEKAVRGHVTAHLPSTSAIVLLDVVEDLLQRAAIKKVFQFRCPPLGIDRTVRRLPILVIIIAPFTLESFRVTGAPPEFRLFKRDVSAAALEPFLNANEKDPAVIRSRAHVIDVATM